MKTSSVLPSWRSLLFVPAMSERFIASALLQPADALMIDLEDSVGPDDKVLARERVTGIAQKFHSHGYDVVVRVNRPWRMLVRDLETSVCAEVQCITLPKVPHAGHVEAVAEILDDLEQQAGLTAGHTRIIVMIEDAAGLENMKDIACASERVCGMIVGAEDLALSLRMAVDDECLYVPNVMAQAASRRAGILAIGFIGSVADFSDAEVFRQKIRRAHRLGFDAAFCIHPDQVMIVNEELAPSEKEVAHAAALLEEFERSISAGKAAFKFLGRMVDLPVVEQARSVLTAWATVERLNKRNFARSQSHPH